MNELGKLIKSLRGSESLRDASKRIGISHTYLDTVEKGRDKRSGNPVNPTPVTLKMLSEAYNYPYDSLMKVAGYIENTVIDEDEDFERWISTPADQRFFEEYNQAPEERRAALRDMWEILKKQGKD